MTTLSENKAKGVDRTPWLSKCFEEYFAPGEFIYDRSHMVDVKWRSDGHYCVMLFLVDGAYYVADVAGYEDHYEVCNDGNDMDLETWRRVRVDPYCDGYTTKEDRE